MELLNKNENWWLRFTIVIVVVISLSVLANYNNQITHLKAKYQLDSLSYYKLKCDTLLNENKSITLYKDSIENELFIQKNIVGRYELGLDFLKERRPNEHNLLMHYINTQTE